ncbi:hypothetical protein H7K20_16750 [Priestia aryabhattai]|uniref:Uncharacterized protein n=1 Tax=Priestia aryabhattai TaxID=412384 RepID=A0ABD7X2I4_PRIAR|nr:hypothetical protein [Priestia aryabhattai]MBY0028751.1 hypothetical protein [Priestia aryabhattai]WEA46860.1 hypothetical protein PWO00_13115 [Priestia aryabhattai]
MDTMIAKWIPVPYFQIDQEGTILNSSNTTHSYFPATSTIWNIIHQEDRDKAILMLSQSANSYPITKHLILQIRNNLFGNFKCTIQWKDGIGHLVCTEAKNIKDSIITPSSVQKSLINTQKRLEESEKHLNNVAKIVSIRKH